jgi:hypothetical protein
MVYKRFRDVREAILQPFQSRHSRLDGMRLDNQYLHARREPANREGKVDGAGEQLRMVFFEDKGGELPRKNANPSHDISQRQAAGHPGFGSFRRTVFWH